MDCCRWGDPSALPWERTQGCVARLQGHREMRHSHGAERRTDRVQEAVPTEDPQSAQVRDQRPDITSVNSLPGAY